MNFQKKKNFTLQIPQFPAIKIHIIVHVMKLVVKP
jgi:hypothetical protein